MGSFVVYLDSFKSFFMEDESTGPYLSFYAYASLLMLSSLMLFVSLSLAMVNLLALNMLTEKQIPGYLRSVGIFANIPFVFMIHACVLWHFALILLMFFMCSHKLGI